MSFTHEGCKPLAEADSAGRPRMISYAQHGEDVLLHRLFPADHRGFYVDVGANHPTHHSVTRHFYDRGWRGVNVEPVSVVSALLREERPEDVNLELALSDQVGEMILHEPAGSLGMSTLNPDFARGLRSDGFACVERVVPVGTLADLCRSFVGSRTIDFLKIDVEGHEDPVIRGGDWSQWRPRVVLVEATICPESWELVLLNSGYLLATSDGVNRYYVRSEDADFIPRLTAPLWVTDAFVPIDVVEDRLELQRHLRHVQVGYDEARFVLWETREALREAEARERLLCGELDRLRSIERGRGRLERSAIRVAGLLSDLWRRSLFRSSRSVMNRRAG